jgi:hypothetical protein
MHPPASGKSPARMRNSDDLPAPFAPVIASASPEPTSKPTPVKTVRPPLVHDMSRPESPIKNNPFHNVGDLVRRYYRTA